MAKRIINKLSTVPGKIPLDIDLELGELAVNANDIRVYMKKVDGTIVHSFLDLNKKIVRTSIWTSQAIPFLNGKITKLIQ